MLDKWKSVQQPHKPVALKPVILGICAMDKKALSKPMKELLSRLPQNLFHIVAFGDDCILNQPIESWPVVECLIAFSSGKFPTAKALEYIALRKPFLVNDLNMDAVLNDRRQVYRLLLEQGIDVPKHVLLNREDPSVQNTVEEFDEYIIVNGVQINKPLVEKPVDAEDHNIYIYYPVSAGGGSKRLFRKVNDRSSEFYPDISELRTEGSYIYEEFVITQGTDVKVYTVGPEYGHAEARKSPVVDGKVNRDNAGMEVRFPVILSHSEKEIIKKICTAFRQTVCGFDILRVRGKSYVCDVNGWSFVKNSRKYYDDASSVLSEYILSNLRPRRRRYISVTAAGLKPAVKPSSTSPRLEATEGLQRRESESSLYSDTAEQRYRTTINSHEELLCVVAVIRHGDRTPKQKMKLVTQEERFLQYFHEYSKSPRKDLKVKSKTALVKFLEVLREVIAFGRQGLPADSFRKVGHIRDVLERWEISGINRKLQMKPQQWEEIVDDKGVSVQRATEIEMILKWGGDLTPLGREQAEKVGAIFRHQVYTPGDTCNYQVACDRLRRCIQTLAGEGCCAYIPPTDMT
jgi:inositol hexakisphosphate/diphosphoinositol-pentakisphosphate kinase